MGNIRDMMGSFEFFQPTELDGALSLLRRHGTKAWVLSGGLDTFDWLKDRAKRPEVVVDLGAIEELRGIRETADGIEIGAMTTLTEISTNPTVMQQFALLARAAGKVATPQIRNQGTLGGNLSQDTRCWYYRSGWPCYRAGGNTCYANTPTSLNREHAIFEADRCVAASPTDVGPAMIALDAEMVVRGRRERVVRAEDFFIGPSTDIQRMTVVEPDELLVAVRIPSRWAGKPHYFEKVADRQSWDFSLVNVSAIFDVEGDVIREARVVVGAVAARPLRMHRVEQALEGQSASAETIERASRLALNGARPLRYNGYKVALTRNLVKRAIRDAQV